MTLDQADQSRNSASSVPLSASCDGDELVTVAQGSSWGRCVGGQQVAVARVVKQLVAKLPEVGGVLGGERGEVQGGEGGIMGGVGVAEDYLDGPFLYLFKATELGDCETWRPGKRGIS